MFLVAPILFCFRKIPWKSKFSFFLTSKRHSGGYFEWKTCNSFQKISSSTRYINAKFIKNTSMFLVALLRFCFRKKVSKMLNFQISDFQIFCESCSVTSRKYVSETDMSISNLLEKLKYFLPHSSTFYLEK